MNYHDINEKVIADTPIGWFAFQSIMTDIGYEIAFQNQETKKVHFKLKIDAENRSLKETVTIKQPDKWTKDGENLAYEKSYVVDLMVQISGGDAGEAIAKLRAKRDIH